MEKKYIIAGVLGLLAVGFTTTSALEIKKPGIATPIYKAVFIGDQRNGNSTCGTNKPTCIGSTSPICLDTCGWLRFNLPSAGGNILKISLWGVRNIFAGPLTTQDLPDGIINSLHIADGAVTQLKLNLNKVGGWGNSITLPTQAWVYKKSIISGKTFNTCEPWYVGVGLSWEIRVISGSIVSGQVVNCVKADWLKNDVPPYPTDGWSYALVQSWTTWVWVSSVLGVLWAEGGDTNWVYRSTSSSGEIGNRNVGNVGVWLTNPDAKLAVNESFSVNNWIATPTISEVYCQRTDTWVPYSSYKESDCVGCADGYTYNSTSNMCEKTVCNPYKCLWSFENATLVAKTSRWLTQDTQSVLSACTYKKCTWACNSWLLPNEDGSACVPATWTNWVFEYELVTYGPYCWGYATSCIPQLEITKYLGSGKDVVIPESINGERVNAIWDRVFYKKWITSVSLSTWLRTIWDYAFSKNNLTSISLPDTVFYVGNSAFAGNQLISVNLWKVSCIRMGSFRNNPFTGIVLPNTLEEVGSYAIANTQLESLHIPASLEDLWGEWAFAFNKIASLTFDPNTKLKTIWRKSFMNNPISSITIPNSVTRIECKAFCNFPNVYWASETFCNFPTTETTRIPWYTTKDISTISNNTGSCVTLIQQ